MVERFERQPQGLLVFDDVANKGFKVDMTFAVLSVFVENLLKGIYTNHCVNQDNMLAVIY